MIRLAAATGMRLKEVTELCWDHVDKVGGTLHVSQNSETGTRAIPLTKVLGHSTPVMTQRYAHLAPDRLRGTANALDAVLTGPE